MAILRQFFSLLNSRSIRPSPAVFGAVVRSRHAAVGLGGDHRFDASSGDLIADGIGIVAAIGKKGCDPILDHAEQRSEALHIVRLARRQTERDRSSNLVRQGMNLGRPSAARAPDRMGILPPFAPLAERCALMEVLSALVVPITPEDPDKT